jgi:hypothetical protein
MSVMERSGWEKPLRLDQLELFARGRDRALMTAGVSIDEVERWRGLGWISFDVREEATVDSGRLAEICFVRNLAHSGLSDLQIERLLGELEPPYRYDPTVTAYSFAFGWVRRPPPATPEDRDEFIGRHLRDWARERVAFEDDERLDRLILDATAEIAEARRQRNEVRAKEKGGGGVDGEG